MWKPPGRRARRRPGAQGACGDDREQRRFPVHGARGSAPAARAGGRRRLEQPERVAEVKQLTGGLASAANRPVRIPLWGPWSLLLDDLLTTRMMELAVHSDDLAVSVGIATPAPPERAVDTVIQLLSRLAVRRHGPTAVLRALSRAERAPATVAAF
jgi:hypothetical protein